MAANNSRWNHLKAALANLHDHLRCWTCNQVLEEPVGYRCGHFFCGQCAKEAGTKCSTCQIPSLASEIQPDRMITEAVECFRKLSAVVNSDRKDSAVTNNGSNKSSRSTVYEVDTTLSNKQSAKPNADSAKKTACEQRKDKESIPTVLSNRNENHSKALFGKKSGKVLNESSSACIIDEGSFLRPSRVRKTKTAAASKRSNTTVSNELLSTPVSSGKRDEDRTTTTKKGGKPRGRPPKKRSSSVPAETVVVVSDEEDLDNSVTAKKPKRIPSTSKENLSGTPLRKSGRELIKRNHKGETPLHVACVKGDVEKIRSLLEANACPNTKDYAGWTPLHEVVNQSNVAAVELLLGAGVLVDVPGIDNVTPLYEAVSHNDLHLVKMLVAHGANIYARTSDGKTPWDIASTEAMREALHKPEKLAGSNKSNSGKLYANLIAEDMVLYGDPNLTPEEKEDLRVIAIKRKVMIASDYGPNVTHFVVASDEINGTGTCPPSIEVLCAILKGVYMLTRDCIQMDKSGAANFDNEIFELSGVTDFVDAEAPKLSRLNAQKQLPGLFNGCHFYVSGNAHYKLQQYTLTRPNIMTLVKAGGGTILSRQPDPEAIPVAERTVPYHASREGLLSATSHFILYTPGKGEPEMKYNMKHCKTLTVEWFINCVFNWQLMDP